MKPWMYATYDLVLAGYTYEQHAGFYCSDDINTLESRMYFIGSLTLLPVLVWIESSKKWKPILLSSVWLITGFLIGAFTRLILLRNQLYQYVYNPLMRIHHASDDCYIRNTLAFERWALAGMIATFVFRQLYLVWKGKPVSHI